MLAPRRVVQNVLVHGGLLDHSGAQLVALLPRADRGGVVVDPRGDGRGFAVLAGAGDGVAEDGEGDGTEGDVEGELKMR